MNMDTENILESILERISQIDYVKPDDIPDIDLYMDQVTTFMDGQLSSSKRHEEDKVLTKTMINNYAKNNLLPPPVKKKYSKQHVLVMIFIYYLKNILSIKDIETLLAPLTEKYFDNGKELNITSIYEEICAIEMSHVDSLQEDVTKIYAQAMDSFAAAEGKERDYLQFFSFICSLSFDVYMKKLLIEQLIDRLPEPERSKKKKEK